MCNQADMFAVQDQSRITQRVVDALYVEAMVLADEARAYFDRYSKEERDLLDPVLRVSFSCESLKVTTRLMHIIAWLLTRRGVENGEIDPIDALKPNHRLGEAVATEPRLIARFPAEAIGLISASCDLYDRVSRLDAGIQRTSITPASPARALLHQLEQALA